ncbi:hypothetical protein [Derxia lacustris]|uniref:hypothetical protein n=1 Tax=Derxia lacustris TaxID=764842 RepID=UPI000A172D0D|nr:hypothetical protein [Derxia lacustris]
MSYFCHLSPRQKWSFVAMRVRCALHPEHPEMVEQFVQVGGFLAQRSRIDPWEAAVVTAQVLLDTATDRELPLHWRNRCMRNLPEQLALLDRMALSPADMQQAQGFRRRAELAIV